MTLPTQTLSKSKEYELLFREKYYKSQKELCEDYQCKKSNIYRIKKRRNLSFIDSLEYYLKNRTIYEVEGKIYHSVPSLAKAYHMPISLVRSRLRLGWTVEEVVELVNHKKRKRDPNRYHPIPVTIDGITYSSMTEAAKKLDVTISCISKRISKNYKGYDITFRNKTYKSKAKLCKEFDCTVSNIGTIAKKKNITFIEALEYHLANRKIYILEGNTYYTKTSVAKAYGISRDLLDSRLRIGWSLPAAVGLKSIKI